MTSRVYLSLGSNIERERCYLSAVDLLRRLGRVAAVSQVYETPAVGMGEAAPFFNGAALLLTDRTPEQLKQGLIEVVEAPLGRIRESGGGWKSRTIDVDIALWEGFCGKILGRPVPDPDILIHTHVAVPLAEIAPDLVHPVEGRTLAAIAADLRPSGALPQPVLRVILELYPAHESPASGPEKRNG